MLTRRWLAVLLAAGALLLTGCGQSPAPDEQLASYLVDHPLTGAQLVRATIVDHDAACDCEALQVVLSLDAADHLAADPELVQKQLAAAMEDLCAFDPSGGARPRYLIDRLGRWRGADASMVIGTQSGLGPRCQASFVEPRSKALVDSVAATASITGTAPAGWANDFTSYAVGRRSSALPVAQALADLSKYASTDIEVHDGTMDIGVEQEVLASPRLVEQLGRLMKVLPEGSRIRSYAAGLQCSDCGGVMDPPDPALVISVDTPPDRIRSWADRAGVDTEPHDGRILLIPSSRLTDDLPTYTAQELQQID